MNFDQKLAAKIDHTLLKPIATQKDVIQLCAEAKEFGFAAVCIPPTHTKTAAAELQDTTIKVATVIGFPMGYDDVLVKLMGMSTAAVAGAQEIDLVTNISAIKSQDWAQVNTELMLVADRAREEQMTLKVIIETGLLTTEEIKKVCLLCTRNRVDFVKTSTGFNGTGASLKAVQLMRKILPSTIQIKASGSIRTRPFALDLLAAGASRLGCSRSLTLIRQTTDD